METIKGIEKANSQIEENMEKEKLKREPLEIIGDFVFEPMWKINLPLHKLLLDSITGNLAQRLENPEQETHF